ncbi:MAG: hypothetical protein ACFFAQ_12685, partial [Promethearchaeota archaeon]
SLGFEIDDYFEFVCTELDITELNSVFGGDWATNVGYYMWWSGSVAPSALGQKSKFAIVNITDHPTYTDWWRITYDGWGWIDKVNSFGVTPVRDDYSYNIPMNPSGELWNPSVWIIGRPVSVYLANVSYDTGYSIYENIIYYTGTDIGNFEVNWIYDENTGIVKNFVIKNDVDTVIFELWGFELKIQPIETYNWIVTELNTAELEDVFGSDWDLDLRNTYCWWALNVPSEVGNKSKLEIASVLNHPSLDDWYQFYVDGWNWKDKELLHGLLPDRDDVTYSLPMDPTGVYWNPSVWLIATPVVTFLEELSYYGGTSASGKIVTESNTDVEAYEAIWTYDENLGVTELFQIKNSAGDTIFEVILLEFKIPVGSEFEWKVSKLNTGELENVFGVSWETDIQSLFGTDCNQIDAKMKRKINDIILDGSVWYVYYDVWDWTANSFSSEPNYTTGTSLYCDPEDGFWGSWIWFVPVPAYYYLVGRSYTAGTELSGLTVIQNDTAIEDFQIKYIYDEILGVYKTVQLLNDGNTVIFEYNLISAKADKDGDIPGYDLYVLISTTFLIIGFSSIIFYRKLKKY